MKSSLLQFYRTQGSYVLQNCLFFSTVPLAQYWQYTPLPPVFIINYKDNTVLIRPIIMVRVTLHYVTCAKLSFNSTHITSHYTTATCTCTSQRGITMPHFGFWNRIHASMPGYKIIGCFRPRFCTVRLYWAGESLG